jgi:plastocyanin
MTHLKLLKLIGSTVLIGAISNIAALVFGAEAASPPPAQPTSAPATTAPAVVQVSIDNFKFTPEVITVHPGQEVVWTNRDDVPHTVTATKKSFAGSGALDTDDHFSHVFTTQGQVDYFCAIHPHMTGRVIVK